MRCFYCNSKVRWNNDFDTEETYHESEYNIVSMYQCDECDTWYEVFHQKKEPEIKNKNSSSSSFELIKSINFSPHFKLVNDGVG